MPIDLVRDQIRAFLKSKDPSVLCIRGNWGTGKTYTWDEVLKEASVEFCGGLPKKYSCVSLFGLNSICEVINSIVTQTIDRERIGKDFDPKDIASVYSDGLSIIKKGAGLFGKVLGDGYYDAAMSAASLLIRDRLICIDDIERKGEGLRIVDILGLVSHFKESRKCKIVLLLNDEQLDNRDDFESYLEKVVDINVRFAPSAKDSAEIALKTVAGSDEIKRLVSERTVKLGIDNVRVIRKIINFAVQIEPLIRQYNVEVHRSVYSTIVLMAWCHLQPEIAPSKDFLVRRRGVLVDYLSKSDSPLSAREQEWTHLVTEYGYTHTDEFDIVLLRGIEDGYFKKELVDAQGVELNRRVETDLASSRLRETWSLFRDTFGGDIVENLRRFETCVSENGQFYTLQDVLSVVNMFRDLEYKEEGDRLLDTYIATRPSVPAANEINEMHLYGVRLDTDIRDKLLALDQQQKSSPPVEEMLLMLADNGYDVSLTEPLATLPVDEYVKMLRNYKGSNFRAMRRALTQYNNLTNPSADQIEIMSRANDALLQIATESSLNAYRVRNWGIAERLKKLTANADDDAAAE